MWIRFKDSEGGTALTVLDSVDLIYIVTTEEGKSRILFTHIGEQNGTKIAIGISRKTANAAVDEIFKRLAAGDVAFDLIAWLGEYEEAGECVKKT